MSGLRSYRRGIRAEVSRRGSGGVAAPVLLFEDDFHLPTVDGNKWGDRASWDSPEQGEWGSGNVRDGALFESPHTAAVAEIVEGQLVMKARLEAGLPSGASYRSVELTTEGRFSIPENSISYTEARIKVPGGKALWPAFWLLGDGTNADGNGWPINGETDIFEFFQQNSGLYGRPVYSMHYPADVYTNPPGTWLNSAHVSSGPPAAPATYHDTFHTWGLYRSPTESKLYIDGVLTRTYTQGQVPSGSDIIYNAGLALPPRPFSKPQHIILTLSGGAYAGEGWLTSEYENGDMVVDFVRCWEVPEGYAPPFGPQTQQGVAAMSSSSTFTAGATRSGAVIFAQNWESVGLATYTTAQTVGGMAYEKEAADSSLKVWDNATKTSATWPDVPQGSRAIALTSLTSGTASTNTRAQVKVDSGFASLGVGEDTYTKFRIGFPSDFPDRPDNGNWLSVAQWYASPFTGSPAAQFSVLNSNSGTTTYLRRTSPSGHHLWQVAVPRGQWIEIIWRVKFGRSAAEGGLEEIWMNGVKQTFLQTHPAQSNLTTTGQTLTDSNRTLNGPTMLADTTGSPSFYMQSYRPRAGDASVTVLFDDLIIGRSYADVTSTMNQGGQSSMTAVSTFAGDATQTPAGPTYIYEDTWSSGNWSSDWTYMPNDTSGTTSRSVVNGNARQTAAANGAYRNELLTGLANVANFDLTIEIDPMTTTGTVGNQPAVGFRCSSDPNGTLTGYYLEMTFLNPSYGRLRMMTAPAYSGIGDGFFTHVPGTIYLLRVQANGTAIKAKIWPSGDSQPSAWALEIAPTNYTTGRFCLTLYSPDATARTVEWDNLQIQQL